MGITSARITSITRACDYYNRARVAVRFGSQARGREGWTINNPKAKIVRCMLQLLQQRAGSGPLLASLKMPVWEPYPRIFRMGQPNDAAAEAQKPSALPTSEQMNTASEECMSATPVWWKWNQSNHCSSVGGFRKERGRPC